MDPKNYEPGWFGDAIFYPVLTGPFAGVQTTKRSAMDVYADYK